MATAPPGIVHGANATRRLSTLNLKDLLCTADGVPSHDGREGGGEAVGAGEGRRVREIKALNMDPIFSLVTGHCSLSGGVL